MASAAVACSRVAQGWRRRSVSGTTAVSSSGGSDAAAVVTQQRCDAALNVGGAGRRLQGSVGVAASSQGRQCMAAVTRASGAAAASASGVGGARWRLQVGGGVGGATVHGGCEAAAATASQAETTASAATAAAVGESVTVTVGWRQQQKRCQYGRRRSSGRAAGSTLAQWWRWHDGGRWHRSGDTARPGSGAALWHSGGVGVATSQQQHRWRHSSGRAVAQGRGYAGAVQHRRQQQWRHNGGAAVAQRLRSGGRAPAACRWLHRWGSVWHGIGADGGRAAASQKGATAWQLQRLHHSNGAPGGMVRQCQQRWCGGVSSIAGTAAAVVVQPGGSTAAVARWRQCRAAAAGQWRCW